jgi:hypothetical protein
VGSSFDLMYNVACAQISTGDLSGAKASLLTASEICRSVLSSEGLSEEEIAAESTVIRLQTAFVDLLAGHETTASLEQCKQVLRSTKKDNELLAVAANNLAVLRGATDLPDSLRRLRNTISSASEEKLTRSQLMEIRYNRCILLLHLKKSDECLRTLNDLDSMSVPFLPPSLPHLTSPQLWSHSEEHFNSLCDQLPVRRPLRLRGVSRQGDQAAVSGLLDLCHGLLRPLLSRCPSCTDLHQPWAVQGGRGSHLDPHRAEALPWRHLSHLPAEAIAGGRQRLVLFDPRLCLPRHQISAI